MRTPNVMRLLTVVQALAPLPLFLFTLTLPALADGAPDLSAGFNLLKAHSFDQALDVFNAAARANPDSVGAHFGRAQALESVGRREESVKEFQLCLLLKPSQAVRDKCNRELDYMTTRSSVYSAPPTLTEKDVEKATSEITSQAAERIKAVQSECSYSQRPAYIMRSPRLGYSSRGVQRTQYYPGSVNTFADAQRREQSLKEVADSLRTDMATKPSAWDGIYLSPQGTNLYVRNYVTFDAQKPEVVEPMKAQEMSFNDMKKQQQKKK